MKLSSLNKFKGKEIEVEYLSSETHMRGTITGIVEEVNQDDMTIEGENSLTVIPIEDIKHIELVEAEEKEEPQPMFGQDLSKLM